MQDSGRFNRPESFRFVPAVDLRMQSVIFSGIGDSGDVTDRILWRITIIFVKLLTDFVRPATEEYVFLPF